MTFDVNIFNFNVCDHKLRSHSVLFISIALYVFQLSTVYMVQKRGRPLLLSTVLLYVLHSTVESDTYTK